MKKIFLLPLILVIVLVSVLVLAYISVQPASGNTDFRNFVINKGASAGQVGANLHEAGLVKSATAFKIYTQLTGISGKISTGEFRLSPSFNLFQTVDALLKGPTEIWVTIPEGLRREEIAARFTSALDENSAFYQGFLAASKGEEGMLFPDTYLFPKDASASSVVNKMTKTFGEKTNNLAAPSGLNFDERLILASILERETKTDTERPVVAGILLNRLAIGMALQVDATVQYAVGTARCKNSSTCSWWEPLLKADLEINSPYNSYKFTGLPPAPISNPGLSSLNAAFNPAKTDFLYYIHDPQGQIHYAKTLQEQNANINKYLQ